MLRKLIAFALSLVVLLGTARPASAFPLDPSIIGDSLSGITQGSGYVLKGGSHLLSKCFLQTPENGLEEVSCNILKTGVEAGVVVGGCYIVSTAAAGAFPPAAALAPVCNTLGAGVGGEGLKKGFKILAH